LAHENNFSFLNEKLISPKGREWGKKKVKKGRRASQNTSVD
jgi:hypothetical protein